MLQPAGLLRQNGGNGSGNNGNSNGKGNGDRGLLPSLAVSPPKRSHLPRRDMRGTGNNSNSSSNTNGNGNGNGDGNGHGNGHARGRANLTRNKDLNLGMVKADERDADERQREIGLLLRLVPRQNMSLYWDAPELPIPAPACGLVRASLYTRAQRLGLLQFTLFNWIISEKRNRYFPRRTQATNLWFEVGDPPSYRLDEVVLPANAAKAQVFDLIPGAAYHGEQLASRCHRPESAVGAAAANKLHREAELLKETQRTIQSNALASSPQIKNSRPLSLTALDNMTVAPAPVSSNPFTAFLSQNAGDEPLLLKLEISSPIKALQHPASKPTSLKAASLDDGLFLHCPLRLLDTDDDEVVHLGSWSKADNPAPGPRKAGAGDKSAQTSPATSHTTLETSASGDGDLPTPLEDMAVDPYPGLDGLDPRFLRLLTNAPAEDAASSPWMCSCGTPNIAGPTYCQRTECGLPRVLSRPEPPQTCSALGDPGDWYCDHCGLCNWTRRAFCLRCCPLHSDNIEESISKGLVHYDDPIIAILGYCEKRARARKKAQSGGNGRSKVHCACFGPHHGTRCPTPMRAVPDNLWAMYVESQELLLGSMSSPPAPAPKHLPLPQLQSQPRSQASASPPGNSHVPAWRRGRR